MTGTRDKLIHEYHGVDLAIIWEVVKTELPLLKPKLAKLLQYLQSIE